MKFNPARILVFMILVLLSVNFMAASKPPKPKAWPQNQIEHDLPFDPNEIPRLIPLDQLEGEIATRKYEDVPLPEFPVKKWRGYPANYDLLAAQSPVKNQGGRGQCHNFATTAAFEYAVWAGDGLAKNFSEQCNAWKFYNECQNCCGNPDSKDDGGYTDREIIFIKDQFMKFEDDFPYSSKDATLCETQYNEPPVYDFSKILSFKQRLNQIKAAVDNHFAVVTMVKWTYEGWNSQGEYKYLENYPPCDKDACGGHAVVIVGYDDHYFGQGKGGWIFKNSWSTSWGDATRKKPSGYGVFPYPYLAQFGYNYVAVAHENVAPKDWPAAGGCRGR
jgi:C1A family cysteine protease